MNSSSMARELTVFGVTPPESISSAEEETRGMLYIDNTLAFGILGTITNDKQYMNILYKILYIVQNVVPVVRTRHS